MNNNKVALYVKYFVIKERPKTLARYFI